MSPIQRQHPAVRKLSAWLAALAMLMLALAPSVTRVLAAADAASWVPVCTADGLVQVQMLAGGERIPNPAEHIAQADCPYCALQGHAHVLASSAPALALPALPAAAQRAPDGVAFHGAAVWSTAQARAPPPA